MIHGQRNMAKLRYLNGDQPKAVTYSIPKGICLQVVKHLKPSL